MPDSPIPSTPQTRHKAMWALILTIVVMQLQWLINGGNESQTLWTWVGSWFFDITVPSPDMIWASVKALIFATISSVLGGGIVGKAVDLIPNRPLT